MCSYVHHPFLLTMAQPSNGYSLSSCCGYTVRQVPASSIPGPLHRLLFFHPSLHTWSGKPCSASLCPIYLQKDQVCAHLPQKLVWTSDHRVLTRVLITLPGLWFFRERENTVLRPREPSMSYFGVDSHSWFSCPMVTTPVYFLPQHSISILAIKITFT